MIGCSRQGQFFSTTGVVCWPVRVNGSDLSRSEFIERHPEVILIFLKHDMTNAVSAGLNSRIKGTLKKCRVSRLVGMEGGWSAETEVLKAFGMRVSIPTCQDQRSNRNAQQVFQGALKQGELIALNATYKIGVLLEFIDNRLMTYCRSEATTDSHEKLCNSYGPTAEKSTVRSA